MVSPTRGHIASNCGLNEMNQIVIVMLDRMLTYPFGDVVARLSLRQIEKWQVRVIHVIDVEPADDIVGEVRDPVQELQSHRP